MAYAVIRTDLMSGTKQPADLVSIRFYGEDDQPAEVENGVIVKLEGYEDGQREVIKAKAAKPGDKLSECAIVAGVEVMYDERKKNLDEYINEKGKAVRAYIPRSRNLFALTKEGFQGGTVPAKDGDVGIGDGGKLSTSAKDVGKCVHIETRGRYTYYTIQIGAAEPAVEAGE